MQRKLLYVIEHWYLFVTVLAVTKMFGLYDCLSFLLLAALAFAFICIKKIEWTNIDILVMLFVIYNLFTGLFQDYPLSLYYYAVKNQIIPILFYFIARSSFFSGDKLLSNAKNVFLLIFISSIFLYFFPPSFYTEYKLSGLPANASMKVYYEWTRMSGFWPAPYFLGAASIISVIHVCNKIFIKQEFNKGNWVFLFLAIVCLFFSQMRVAIAYSILFLLALTVITIIYRLKTSKILLWFLFFIAIAVIAIYHIVINYMPQEFVDFVFNRTVDQDGGMISDRILMFKDFFRYISFLGAGLGRFGHMAMEYNMYSITDCDYLRILCEIGYFGLALLLIIVLGVIIKGVRIIRECFCDLFILGYFMAAMIGAAPLISFNQHSFLFWFCLGHIVQSVQCYEKRISDNENCTYTLGV